MYPLSFPALQKALDEMRREKNIQDLLKERASDLWGVICSIAADIEQRKSLEQTLLRQVEDNLLKVSNERLTGNAYAWKDWATFEVEKLREHQESFRDIQQLKHLLRQYLLQYRETARQLDFLQEVMPSEKTIAALKPVLKEGADLLYLSHTLKTETGILLQPPKQDDVEGEFILGMVIFDRRELYPLKLPRQALSKHILIAGETGIGKTNLSV
jgi:hypothetical protein